ncbi:hypothetical protein SteCoe_37409 [Stentor coeruleus]|uniref:Uncharacterized protein n=1 Tax=Stentor coeruleus TaxID=5963 RepID=A0A1R2AN49_9CILI|nr:hypothetical protein SteCoe_37409 [Stentor coeruleus]
MEPEVLITRKDRKLSPIKPVSCETEPDTQNSPRETESNNGNSQNSGNRLEKDKKNCQIMRMKTGRIPIAIVCKNQNPQKVLGVIPEVHITPQELLSKLKLREAMRKKKTCACNIF